MNLCFAFLLELKPTPISLTCSCFGWEKLSLKAAKSTKQLCRCTSRRALDLNPPPVGRHGGLQVQALARGHSIVFLGKTLNFDSASLHPGVQMDTREFIAWGDPAMD